MQGIRATVVGNLTSDPDVRAVGASSVANFDIAVNDGYRDKDSGEWVEKGTTHVRAAIWASIAENVGETLRKGDEVVCTGSLATETYKNKEGQERTALVLRATEVALSLRWAVAQVHKVKKGTRAPFVTPDAVAAPAALPPVAPGQPF